MVKRKTWDEFRSTGLLLFINQVLHVFGWAIVFEIENNSVVSAYPARVKFRGFDSSSVSDSYKKISNWVSENHDELLKEASDD